MCSYSGKSHQHIHTCELSKHVLQSVLHYAAVQGCWLAAQHHLRQLKSPSAVDLPSGVAAACKLATAARSASVLTGRQGTRMSASPLPRTQWQRLFASCWRQQVRQGRSRRARLQLVKVTIPALAFLLYIAGCCGTSWHSLNKVESCLAMCAGCCCPCIRMAMPEVAFAVMAA